MTFKEAKDKLRELAQGRYHAIEYELTEYAHGGLKAGCRLYIDPNTSTKWQPTWEMAFDELQKVLNPPKLDNIDLTEAPE